MLDPDQDQALQNLAYAIRQCVSTLGAACTARLLATVARDLHKGHEPDTGTTSLPVARHSPPFGWPMVAVTPTKPRHADQSGDPD